MCIYLSINNIHLLILNSLVHMISPKMYFLANTIIVIIYKLKTYNILLQWHVYMWCSFTYNSSDQNRSRLYSVQVNSIFQSAWSGLWMHRTVSVIMGCRFSITSIIKTKIWKLVFLPRNTFERTVPHFSFFDVFLYYLQPFK